MAARVGQIDAQRFAAAAANLEIIMKKKGLDILCLQESFCYKGTVWGYNLVKIEPQYSEYS